METAYHAWQSVDGRTAFEFAMATMMGIGLAAACGFRVFAPLFLFALAHRLGWVEIYSEYAWVSTDLAMVVLGVAVAAETTAMYVPWVDAALTAAATPLAILAGSFSAMVASAPQEGIFEWVVPLVAGGMAAGFVHGTTVAGKALVTSLTGGIASPIVSTLELIAAVLATILAIVVPMVMFVLLVLAGFWAWRIVAQFRANRLRTPLPATTG
jgi:hypothetical protein